LTREPVRVAIFGASGYTGYELLRLLCGHQGVTISRLFRETHHTVRSRRWAGPGPILKGFTLRPMRIACLRGWT